MSPISFLNRRSKWNILGTNILKNCDLLDPWILQRCLFSNFVWKDDCCHFCQNWFHKACCLCLFSKPCLFCQVFHHWMMWAHRTNLSLYVLAYCWLEINLPVNSNHPLNYDDQQICSSLLVYYARAKISITGRHCISHFRRLMTCWSYYVLEQTIFATVKQNLILAACW